MLVVHNDTGERVLHGLTVSEMGYHSRFRFTTGAHAKVREFESTSKRISDFRPGLHKFHQRIHPLLWFHCTRKHQNTGDTSVNCRIKWVVTILLLSRVRP